MTPQQAQAELARRELSRRQRSTRAQQFSLGDLAQLNPVTGPAFLLDRLSRQDSTAGGVAAGVRDGLGWGWTDELSGIQSGLGAALTGGDFGQAYNREVGEQRQNLNDQWAVRPIATGAGQLGGSIASGVGPGMSVTRAVASPGARIALGASVGAGTGAVSAAGSADPTNSTSVWDDLAQRAPAAGQGALLGAALGGGFQSVAEAAPAIGRGIQRGLRLPDYRGQGVAGMASEDLMRTAQSNRALNVRTPEDLANAIETVGAQNPDATVAEALGQQGVQRLAFLARARGETGQRVEDLVRARNRNQSGVLEDAFIRSPASADVLEQQVREQWRERGAALYEPILSAPPTRESLRAFVGLRNSPLFQHRAIQSAWRRSGDMIRDDISLGRIPPGAANSVRHQLHYAKVALDEMIEDPTRLEPGLRNMNNASIAAAREQLLGRMERIIPGYTQARGELADIGAARRAIDAGRQAFTRQRFASDEALQRHMAAMPPGERQYFQAGVEEWIANTIATAGRDGRRNVASSLLNDRFQNRLRIVFGQDAEFMLQRARAQADLFESGNRMRPTTGSITSNMAFEAGDMSAPPIPTQGNMLDAAWRWGWNNTVGRVGEQHRNLMGRVYATPAREFRGAQGGLLARARREAERRQARTRLNRTRGAVLGGLGAVGVIDPREEDR